MLYTKTIGKKHSWLSSHNSLLIDLDVRTPTKHTSLVSNPTIIIEQKRSFNWSTENNISFRVTLILTKSVFSLKAQAILLIKRVVIKY